MRTSRATGTGNSSGIRVLLRICSGFLQIILNIALYGIVIWMIAKGAKYAYNFAYDVMGNSTVEDAPGRDVKIQLLKGESLMNIATKLETNKIIDNKLAFFVRAKLNALGAKNGKGDIQPGTFILNTSMTYRDILRKITDYSQSIADEETVEDVESLP